MPKVSVIIAVYNGARTIAKSIQSAQIQTLHDIEILVIDDGSQDNTCEIVEALSQQDQRIKLFRQPQNAGPAAARNRGIQEATGEWIAILDADDWMEPVRLKTMLAAGESARADVVGDNMEIFDHALDKIIDKTNFCGTSGIRSLTVEQLFRLDNPMRRYSLGYVQPLIRRDFLLKHALGYRVDYRIGEDFLLLAEILLNGGKFIIVPGAYYVYRHTFSPTTHKKSDQSHTEDRYDLIICGCDELMAKYGQAMTSAARSALLRRRKIFESRIVLKYILRLCREKRYLPAIYNLFLNPFVCVQIALAVFKLVYANLLGLLHRNGRSYAHVEGQKVPDMVRPSGKPRVTVVIAVLNGMKTIARAIESAQYQTERNIEIVVVDDGSTDGTAGFVNSIAQRDPRVKCIKLEKNAGAAAATNIAIRQSKADWCAILDADDWMEPERLEMMLKEAHSGNVDAVYDNLQVYDHALGRITYSTHFGQKRKSMPLTVEYFFKQDTPLHRTAIGYLKPLIRKQFLLDHNLFYDETNRVGYDFTMIAEILLNGGRMTVIPGAYYDYVHMFSPTTRKQSPTSHTKNNYARIIDGSDQLIRKYGEKMSPVAKEALLRRRHMFESRMYCNDMIAAWQDGKPFEALRIIAEWPFILAILAAAFSKMLYANFCNIWWHLKHRVA